MSTNRPTPSNNAPIGVFDSGLGGLSAVRELRAILPGEDIIYFGDTGRVPYGGRGRDTIIAYARQDIAFLLSQGVKTVLAACGTVSSTFPEEEGARLPVGFMGVVQATVNAALAATQNGRIGIIATEATIASGSYQNALLAAEPGIQCAAGACPLFVPMVENGHYAKDDPMVQLACEEYLANIRQSGIDTLIMGCTHYPLLAEAISQYMGPNVQLINSGREAALALKARLAAQNLLADTPGTGGHISYYISDDPTRFGRLARIFLQEDADQTAQRIEIERFSL